MNSGGQSIPEENDFQIMNGWVSATTNNAISSRGSPFPIQLQGSNLGTSNWQQLLELPDDHPLGSVSWNQPAQDLDPYGQAGRNGGHIFNPNSFMALLGVDGPLLENQGINQVSQDCSSINSNFSRAVDTLGSDCSTMNPLPMASQFVAQNRSFQSPQSAEKNRSFKSQFAGENGGFQSPQFAGQNTSFQSPQFAAENRSFQSPQFSRPVIPNLNDHATVNWVDNNSAVRPLLDQNHSLIASACNANKDVFQLPEEQFLVGRRLEYDLNTPARAETEASFDQTPDFFHHMPVTPNHAPKSQHSEQCEILKLPEPGGLSSLVGDKEISLAENGTQQTSEFPRSIVDTSSGIISTTSEKIMGNDKEGGQVIDLNKTPQHKTPKRRKHRPKVIREGKPKKIPKSETPKNFKSTERPKRKYTRKNNLKTSEIQPSGDEGATDDLSKVTAAKSCRRALSFEQQKMAEQGEDNSNTQPQLLNQMSGRENLDNQATEICAADNDIFNTECVDQLGRQNEFPQFIHPTVLVNKLGHSTPQVTIINRPQAVRPPPTRTTTFQDLLMGNFNSAGGTETLGKSNLSRKGEVFGTYMTKTITVGAQSALMCRQNELQTLYQHTSTTSYFNCSMPQQTINSVPHAVRDHPTQATSFQELLMKNGDCAQSTLSSKIDNVNQDNWRSYNPGQRFTDGENNEQLALQTKNTHDSLVECGKMILYRSTQPVMITSSVQKEARRSKREREFVNEQHCSHNITSTSSSLSSRVINQADGYNSGYAMRQELPDAEKKRRTENMPCVEMSNTQNLGSAGSNSRQFQANKGNNAHANMRPLHFNPYPWMSYATNSSHSNALIRTDGVISEVSTSSAAFDHSTNWLISSEQPSHISQLQESDIANGQVSPFLAPVSNYRLQPVPAKTNLSDNQQTTKNGSSTAIKQYSRPTASGLLVTHIRKAAPSGYSQAITTTLTNRSSKMDDARFSVSTRKKGNDKRPPSFRKKGQLRKQDFRDLIDDIISQMDNLKLDNVCENANMQPENAIVPYKGDGPVVMYQVKKRKPRPKVDLDSESERVWKLLMGKVETEGAEGTDADKEKWWEEERKIFRGRANSFIARMHLVQGDRRFSRWKGSVVDSVIGVFLTQNVSDHLSSSAFMLLAARFPHSISSRASCTVDDGIIEEPDICIIDLEDVPNNESKQVLSYAHSITSQEEGNILTTRPDIVNHIRGANEETISVESFNSSICLTSGGSCSGSNSEVEDQLSTLNPIVYDTNKPTEVSQRSQRVNLEENPGGSLHHPNNGKQPIIRNCEYHLQLQLNSSPRACVKDSQPLLGRETMSLTPTCDATECSSNTSPALQNSKNTRQNGQPREQAYLRSNLNEQPGSHILHQEGILTTAPGKETANHSCSDQQQKSLIFHSEQTSKIHEVTGPNLKEKGLTSAAQIKNKGSSPKTKKGKQDTDKKLIDWDILRKEAHCNNRRPRTKDAMDSMDYETMRHANVKEISEAIKERGMNNMLAERIKDFLNRLVTDHGSIDLEWLRDAPPDKAKDYLLSIRGLGLKSVECVRLLTLHHLAFPVDTNVGRIAVRLGWVPLQPLPESLQLHLLELYPVLETIQKYLWPRLCKLDQRTLYQLHYQMITFGKVFCTKSKPNCNACPMRAECRHFASAFASARLALPGPEEKNLVPSRVPVPVPSDSSPATDTPFQPLLEWDNQLLEIERSTKANCEPIIEEPTTPEQDTAELSEIDIEDSFGEDPNEIPTIRLDFQEFTQNLQSYMQENNVAVHDDDMSKALVALTAEAASLPPQKLKNVSRLRTEHQVYELPDSHPLIKEMDRREPDDPSPYLLAIWTPGETANSTQPPESRCEAEGPNKMCSEKTCFSCNSRREANSNIVRGTLLIPCRTAMRGSFPLNGTYFQVNEMFADHESSMNPIDVPREWIWNLPKRTVYFGTSVASIFKGLSTEGIQYCFWRGFVCVRGFDQRYRAPRPLLARLHHPASRLVKKSKEEKK